MLANPLRQYTSVWWGNSDYFNGFSRSVCVIHTSKFCQQAWMRKMKNFTKFLIICQINLCRTHPRVTGAKHRKKTCLRCSVRWLLSYLYTLFVLIFARINFHAHLFYIPIHSVLNFARESIFLRECAKISTRKN